MAVTPAPEKQDHSGKTNLDLLEQEIVSGSRPTICWAICKYASHPREITTPASYHSVFYRPDALPAVQPTRQSTEGELMEIYFPKIFNVMHWQHKTVANLISF